jgi:hypothetical protein
LSRDHGFSRDARPYIYQEVIDLGTDVVSKYEYTPLGAVTEFRVRFTEYLNSTKNYIQRFIHNSSSEMNLGERFEVITI